ncbi:MAG: hypothetical protein FJ135_05600 [Deltaproteobacteria bacterium]|nr:hypothetical protein [Deltaproteobacteria bacterium]
MVARGAMRFRQAWLGAILLGWFGLGLLGCSFSFPAAVLPPPLPVQKDQGKVASTLFPLPVIGTDPNSGNDFGFLPVWVFPRDDEAIGMILAPSAIYNDNAKTSLAFRLLAYPSPEVHYRAVVDPSTHIQSFYEFAYEKTADQPKEWSYKALFVYDCDIFPRFYGFGNASSASNQTSYTSRGRTLQATLGYQLSPTVEVRWHETFNITSLSDNHLPNLRSTQEVFPEVMQDRRNTAFTHGLSVTYDTRDYQDTPTCGFLGRLFAETSRKALGSDSSYDRLGFELKGFQPWDPENRRQITAVHLSGEFLTRESDTPFYRWPSLGGYTSNRGWGKWRWIDRNMVSLTLEQRMEIFQLRHFGVVSHFEMAPFIDVGKVFPTFSRFNFRGLHPAAGIGFRAVVRPQVVGHVEVGIGRGGNNAVFMGLGYPF